MKLNTTLIRTPFLLCIFFLLPSISFAQDGSLDPSFGTNGIVITSVGTGSSDAYSVAIQTDGKIVVVGENTNSNNKFALARYNLNGSLDTSFGNAGKVLTTFSTGSYDGANKVVIQSDGKIVVVGQSYTFSNNSYYFAVARYNTNGTLDTSFDTDGKVTTAIGIGTADIAQSVAIQSNGKIVVAGWNNYNSNRNFAVVRYNTNGSLDTSFDTDGIVTTSVGNDSVANSVALQSDGKIVVGGSAGINGTTDIAIVRYNSNGSLDTTFDGDGIVTTAIGTSYENLSDIVIQPNGKIIGAGSSNNGNYNEVAVVRYNPDGSLDTSFDTDGKVTTDIGPYNDEAHALVWQSDGKIVTAGVSGNGINNYYSLVRYNVDGSLDSTFGSAGKVVTAVGTANYCHANDVILQSDGKIVAVGFTSDGSTASFGVVRYTNTILATNTFTDSNKTLLIYPNPTKSILNVSYDRELNNVAVYNLLGQLVLSKTINNIEGSIDVSNLCSGSYFAKVYVGDKVKTLKFVKE